jgi:hypothetical protein
MLLRSGRCRLGETARLIAELPKGEHLKTGSG